MTKKSPFKRIWLSREVRLAIIVAILSAAGTIACASGYWEAGIGLLLLAAGVVAAFWFLVVRPARVPRDAVVMLRLAGTIHEGARRAGLDLLVRRGVLTLDNVRTALEAAAGDAGVRAVVVQIAGFDCGLATANELHRLLRAAHDSGKRVIALIGGDQAGLREYLVAAGAGQIVINPDTMLTMLGVAMGSPFLKSALEKAEVQVQTLQWKEYKGAGETFSRDAMSPEVRESLEAIIGDWERILVDAIAAARKLPAERARELVAGGFMSARSACEAGLADRHGYIEEIRAEFDPAGEGKPFVGLGRYLRHIAFTRERARRPAIALVHGTGPVISGEAPPTGEFISGETTARQIERASRDDRVRAIVFRVNSPGGSAAGSDLVWRAVRQARERGKPVVVSMGDVAGSGGYYVAMGADAIVAEPATITGSIGVVFAKFNLSRLLADVGVKLEYVKSAGISDAFSISRGMTEEELAQLNDAVGELYGNFTAKVSEGRRLDPERTEALARGRVWSGVAAKERGLVDDLGGLARAIEIARERAKIPAGEPHQLVTFAARERFFGLDSAFAPAAMPWAINIAAERLGIPRRWAPALFQMLLRGGALLLCPFVEM